MPVVEKVIDKVLMTGIIEDILLPDPNPEDKILQEVPITDRTTTIIEATTGSSGLQVYPNLLIGGPELHPGPPVGIITDVLSAGNFVILPENVLRKMLP